MVFCMERGADLHMAQLMPRPLTVSCFSKIQIGFTFVVPAHLGNPGKGAVKRVCVCVCLSVFFAVKPHRTVSTAILHYSTLTAEYLHRCTDYNSCECIA